MPITPSKHLCGFHQGDFALEGDFFTLDLAGAAPGAYIDDSTSGVPDAQRHAFDLGNCLLDDLTDPANVASLLQEALEDRGPMPLTRVQRQVLQDHFQQVRGALGRPGGVMLGDLFGSDVSCPYMRRLFDEVPQLRYHARVFGAGSGVVMNDASGKRHAFVTNYQSVRNWDRKTEMNRPTYDRSEMASDESRNNNYAMVHLADDEWDNNIMWMAALDHFAKNPDCRFVEVIEHAGWRLGFCRDDAQIWSTANDAAGMDPKRPMPTGYSGVCVRRVESIAALRREAQRHHLKTLGSEPAQICDFAHDGYPAGVTRAGLVYPVNGEEKVGTVTYLRGGKSTVREVIPALPEAVQQQLVKQNALLQENLAALGVPPERAKDFTWFDDCPYDRGRLCWEFTKPKSPERQAFSATMDGVSFAKNCFRLSPEQQTILEKYRPEDVAGGYDVTCCDPEPTATSTPKVRATRAGGFYLGGDDNDLACALSTIAREIRGNGFLRKAYEIENAAPAGFFECSWERYQREFAPKTSSGPAAMPALPVSTPQARAAKSGRT